MSLTTTSVAASGTVSLGDLTVPRMGFGTMRLTGPGIFGPPADRDECVCVVRQAYDAGVRVFDTSWFYGPYVSNEIVHEALSPYSDDVVLVGKLGGARGEDASWHAALTDAELREGNAHDLRTLGVEAMPVVHLRWMEDHGTGGVHFDDALATLIALKNEGKIQRIGLSTVTVAQLETACTATEIVTVSNAYGPLNRADDDMVAACEDRGIAYLPYFPLSLDVTHFGAAADDARLQEIAAECDASAVQVALAWLLQRSPIMLPIPGTSSTDHLAENLAAPGLTLTEAQLQRLG